MTTSPLLSAGAGSPGGSSRPGTRGARGPLLPADATALELARAGAARRRDGERGRRRRRLTPSSSSAQPGRRDGEHVLRAPRPGRGARRPHRRAHDLTAGEGAGARRRRPAARALELQPRRAPAPTTGGQRSRWAATTTGWPSTGSRRTSDRDGATLTGTLTRGSSRAASVPAQPSDEQPLAVIASPAWPRPPGRAASCALRIAGEQVVARVAAVAERFPGAQRRTSSSPTARCSARRSTPHGPASRCRTRSGSGRRRAGAARARCASSARPPFNVLSVESRDELERSLRDDPLARGTLLTLLAAALVALGLALVGVLLGVVSDVRDERGELDDLEAQGARPALLRRVVRAAKPRGRHRVGSSADWLTAALLGFLVVDLVTVTADARDDRAAARTRRSPGPCSPRLSPPASSRRQPSSPQPPAGYERGRRRAPRRLPRLPGAGGRRRRAPGADAGGPRGRDLRRARPERLREVDAAPHARGTRHGRPPGACASSAATSPGSAGAAGPATARRSSATPTSTTGGRSRRSSRSGSSSRSSSASRACPGTSASAARASCSSASASSTAPRRIRASSPAASSSGWRSALRSPTARGFCSPTSRPASSTPPNARSRLRGDRRARARRRDDHGARQPRPRVGVRSPTGSSAFGTAASARRPPCADGRRRGDRRRPRRLAPPLRGAPAAHGDPLARERRACTRTGFCSQAAPGAAAPVRGAGEEDAPGGGRAPARRSAEARGLSRTYGEGAAAATALVALDAVFSGRPPHRGDGPVGLGEDDAPPPSRRPGPVPTAR